MTRPVSPADPVVVARALRKRFGSVKAVDGIDLDIPAATCTALLGPNGAGKTTVIRMIQCAMPPTSGSLQVLGRDALVDRRGVKSRLGVVPQEDNLDPDFTVHKNLTTYARFYGIKGPEAHGLADRLLAFVGLEGKRDADTEHLSGGMKRRLVIARSLVNDPQLLVLDEPTTGLDPQSRQAVWDKIRALKREGKTVLLTTHYMDEAQHLADRVVIVDHGRILESGTPDGLIERHTGGGAVEFVVGAQEPETRGRVLAVLQEQQVIHEALEERIVAYTGDPKRLQDDVLQVVKLPRIVLRQATLEDVFLRLTGRALRE